MRAENAHTRNDNVQTLFIDGEVKQKKWYFCYFFCFFSFLIVDYFKNMYYFCMSKTKKAKYRTTSQNGIVRNNGDQY